MQNEIQSKMVKISNDWIQVSDPRCPWTIEDFSYETGVVEALVEPHCVKCVAINKCWFKNDDGKKPERFKYTFDLIGKLLELFGIDLQLGIYHPNCHCRELSISKPNEKQIKFIIPPGKPDWMIKDKGHLLKAMGYKESEFLEVTDIIKTLVAKQYVQGNYNFRTHDKTGFKIGFVLQFPGKNEDYGKIYKLKTGWSIFPNGKLKCNTLIGGLIG